MLDRIPPELEMRPDGSFVEPPSAPLATRIFRIALIVTLLAASAAAAIFLLGVALILIPVAIGGALIAWAAFRFQMWRAGKSAGSQRDLFGP